MKEIITWKELRKKVRPMEYREDIVIFAAVLEAAKEWRKGNKFGQTWWQHCFYGYMSADPAADITEVLEDGVIEIKDDLIRIDIDVENVVFWVDPQTVPNLSEEQIERIWEKVYENLPESTEKEQLYTDIERM